MPTHFPPSPHAALASIFFIFFMLVVSLILLSVLLAITIEAFVMSRDVAEVRWEVLAPVPGSASRLRYHMVMDIAAAPSCIGAEHQPPGVQPAVESVRP